MSSGHLTDEQLEAPGDSAHLTGCAQCQTAVARAAARRKLLGGMKPYTLADVGFSRVEAKLMEHVRENPPGPRWSFGRIFAIGALAAVFVLFAVSTVRPLLSNAPLPPPVAAFEPMTVIHASGAVAVKAGDVLDRDATVEATNARVVLSTADGISLRIGGGGKLALGQGSSTVRHLGGTLSFDAQRRGPWVVESGTAWLRSADASFDIAPDTLKLYRGSVLLADSATFANARQINAPAIVELSTGKISTFSSGGALTGALQKTAPSPWARFELTIPASEVELDGQKMGGAPLSMMTTPGRHHLRALVGDQWRETDVDLSSGSPGVVELPEKPTAAVLPPTGPVVEADPAAIAAAVKAQLPKLRVCHEKWLKVNEGARGRVLMTVTVSPKGKVTRAAFSADEGVPDAVSECLGRAVRTLALPRSTEEVELEIPVLLGAQ